MELTRAQKTKQWRINNPEKYKLMTDRRNKSLTKDQIKHNNLKYKHGITLEQYNNKFILQEGKCDICKKHASACRRALAVDHNHKTGQIRSLLCDECNRGIGLLGDDVNRLKSAYEYLLRHDSLTTQE
jgi:hypothetical protein